MRSVKSLARLALVAVPLAGLAAPACAARSDWSDAGDAQLRLLLVPAAAGASAIDGGIEIILSPGWHTYWRTPGDVGIPPVFDFAGSDNVAHVEVRYPAPTRLAEGDSVSLVYEDDAILPLAVTPADPARPVTLRLEARFGVCADICVPASASAEVMLAPGAAPDPLAKARVASVARRIPAAPQPGRFAVESAVTAGDMLEIAVRMPDSSTTDLFAEPPAGWFVGQPTFRARADGVSHFSLDLSGRPAGAAIAGEAFRFTAIAGGDAIEQSVVAQ